MLLAGKETFKVVASLIRVLACSRRRSKPDSIRPSKGDRNEPENPAIARGAQRRANAPNRRVMVLMFRKGSLGSTLPNGPALPRRRHRRLQETLSGPTAKNVAPLIRPARIAISLMPKTLLPSASTRGSPLPNHHAKRSTHLPGRSISKANSSGIERGTTTMTSIPSAQ